MIEPGTFVHLSGRNPQSGILEVEKINLWKDYDFRLAGTTGQGKHGQRVKLIQRKDRGVLVELEDGTQGWLTYWYVKEFQHEASWRE